MGWLIWDMKEKKYVGEIFTSKSKALTYADGLEQAANQKEPPSTQEKRFRVVPMLGS